MLASLAVLQGKVWLQPDETQVFPLGRLVSSNHNTLSK